MMSWQLRMTERNAFMRGPRTGVVSRVVRMWKESGSSRAIAASQNSSYAVES
jgi:hypothetical protein